MENICCPQPGVTANILAQAWCRVRHDVAQLRPRWLVSSLWPVTGCLPENESERPQGQNCVSGTEENVPGYFKAWSCTSCPWPAICRDKQGSPKERAVLQTNVVTLQESLSDCKEKGTKGLTCAHDEWSTESPRWWQQPVCYVTAEPGEAAPGGYECVHAQTHTHTDIHMFTHMRTWRYTLTHPYADMYTFPYAHVLYTHPYSCPHLDTCTCPYTQIVRNIHIHTHTYSHRCVPTFIHMHLLYAHSHTYPHVHSHTQDAQIHTTVHISTHKYILI